MPSGSSKFMKIERMVLSFPDMNHIIVDHEGQLVNYNLERAVGIDVNVSMKMEEFAAFREWKVQFAPKPKEKKQQESVSLLPDVF